MITKKLYLYENRDDVFLTTYLWESSLELPAGERRPLVLICPGGGYLNCSDREAEPVALRFASMGYHAAVLRYSTYGERRDDFARLDTDDFVKPHVLYPAQLRELGMAMLLLRRHAEAWHIDSDRIAICGFSAGANNCALYAANWNKPLLTEVLDARPEQLRPFAVLLSYAVADFSNTEGVKEEELKLYEYMCKAFLGSEEPTREQFDRVNPSLLIDADTPPTFLWATATDRTVPVRNSLEIAAALAAHGVPFELHIFEEGTHGLGLGDRTSAMVTQHMDPNVAGWPALAARWLEKRLALEVPEGA